MASVSGISESSGAGGASNESQWDNQKIEANFKNDKGDNGWRVEKPDSTTSKVLETMVGRMSVEMVKQQNPTQNKFSINDDE